MSFYVLSTRVVHLELVTDMSTTKFLMALRRFIAQRGKPDSILSDNAVTFKAASKVLHQVWTEIVKSEEVQSCVANRRI